MRLHWYKIKGFIFLLLLGYKKTKVGNINIPKRGEICKLVLAGGNELGVLVEVPRSERYSEDEFRYRFELIDKAWLSIEGEVVWKSTGRIHWDYNPMNKDRI